MTQLEALRAALELLPGLKRKLQDSYGEVRLSNTSVRAIIAALEASTDGEGWKVLLNDIRSIADSGGRRIETAIDACDKIVELIDMEQKLGPAPVSKGPTEAELRWDGNGDPFWTDCQCGGCEAARQDQRNRNASRNAKSRAAISAMTDGGK